jgi:hypothetical protein
LENDKTGNPSLALCDIAVVLCLRCMTIWSCAQQPNHEMANCWWNLPCLQASDAGLRPTHSCEMIFLHIYIQGLRCDIQTNYVVCLRCISCWICAQHNMAMCMLLLLPD